MYRYVRDCKKRKNCKKTKLESYSGSSDSGDSGGSDSSDSDGGGWAFKAGVCCWNSYCNQLHGFNLTANPKTLTYCIQDGMYHILLGRPQEQGYVAAEN